MSRDTAPDYDAWHGRLEADVGGESPWHGLVLKHLDWKRDVADRDLLEIGCGRGGFAVRLSESVAQPRTLIGADFSMTAIETARGHFKNARVRWEQQDILCLAYPAGSFDTVISCETIEHVLDPARAVRELARVLKPLGRLFLTTPNYLGLMGAYRGYLRLRGRRYTEAGQPINQFTVLPKTIFWARRAGLLIKRWDAIGHYLPFPGRPPIALQLNQLRVLRFMALHSLVVAEKPGR